MTAIPTVIIANVLEFAGSPTSSPISAPTSTPSASAANEPDGQQQQQRADGSVNDRGDKAGAEVKTELGKEPAADEGTCDPYEKIADNPEPGASHDLTG
jgi:hypothetical protein